MSNFFINTKPPEYASKSKNIKQSNVGLILSLMDFDNAVSAAEIAGATGLSKTTVSKIFIELQAKGLIISAGKGPSTDEGGKKPELFILNENHRHVMVIQLSEPLTIECSVLNLACKIKKSLTTCTEPSITYQDALSEASKLARKLLEDLELTASDICDVVVSCEGVVDPRERIIRKPAHHKWPPNLPLGSDMEQALGFPARVSIDNVCRYGGYAELMLPENNSYSNLIVIWNDDLVGGCVLIDRRMVQGRGGLIGEIGHITIDPHSDVRCTCGAYGCFEPLVSCGRLLRNALDAYMNHPDIHLSSKAKNGSLTLSDIFDAANNGDRIAQQLIDNVTDQYAILIHNMTALHDPQKIILQGVYASAGDYFYRSLNDKVAKNAIHGTSVETVISPSFYRDRIPRTTGAAFYAITKFLNSDVLKDEREDSE